MTDKELAKSVIDAQPEDANIGDIIYALWLAEKLERAERSIREGRGISHEEVGRRLQKWLKPS